jgi:PAS domain S-box-containing protein
MTLSNSFHEKFNCALQQPGVTPVLSSSEAYLNAIFNFSGVAFAVIDTKGRFLLCNQAWEQLIGYSGEISRLTIQEITHPDDLTISLEPMENLLEGKIQSYRIEKRYLHNNGNVVWVDLSVTPIHDEQGQITALVGAGVDITERKHMEEAQRQNEGLFRQIAENIREVLWVRDYKTRQIEYINPAYETIWGRPCESLYQHPESFSEGIHPDDLDRVAQAVRSQYVGIPFNEEYRVIRPDGTIRWVSGRSYPIQDESGQIQRIVGMVEDITEKKLLDDKARIDQQRVNSLLRIAKYKAASQEEVIQEALEEALALSDSQYGFITVYDEDRRAFLLHAWSKQVWEKCKLIKGPSKFLIEQGGILGEAVRQRKPVVINDFQAPNPLKRGIPEGHVQINRLIMVPILSGSRVVAVAGVANKKTDYTGLDVKQLALMMGEVWEIFEHKLQEETLRKLSHAVEQSPALIVITDTSGAIEYVNPKFTETTGYSLDEVVGNNPRLLKSSRTPPDEYESLWRTIQSGGVWQGEFCNRKKSGELYWEAASISSIKNEAGLITHYIAVKEDITRRKQAEEEMELQLAHISALQTIDQAIINTFDFNDLLQICIEQVINQLEVDAVAILHLDPETQIFSYVAEKGFRTDILKNTLLRFGEGYAGCAALYRKTMHIANLENEKGDFVASEFIDQEGFLSYYGIPLIVKGQINGVMELFFRSSFEPDDDWLKFLEIVAGQVAIAIDNSLMFEKLEKTNTDLEKAYDETLEGWSQALELRDKETKGHTHRVAELTVQLARILRLSEAAIVQLRRGALLHDIGKMGIPDSILNKPDKLTPEEWEIMRKHPVYAYELLYPIRYLRTALDIPYNHHEKWDGTGYPRGLKEEQIPLSARIFAVVDVWDALCSDRPYRPAWSKSNALAYIHSQSGKHFDPIAVEAFSILFDEHSIEYSD